MMGGIGRSLTLYTASIFSFDFLILFLCETSVCLQTVLSITCHAGAVLWWTSRAQQLRLL